MMDGQNADTAGDMDKLYEKLFNLFMLFDSTYAAEREGAFRQAVRIVEKINRAERETQPDAPTLTFKSIFEKASAGGGPELDEVLEANNALKLSEQIALKRLQQLEFLYREIQKTPYRDAVKNGPLSRLTAESMRDIVTALREASRDLEHLYGHVLQTLEKNGGGEDGAADPDLIMLHHALKKEMDLKALAADKTPLTRLERLTRFIMKVPLDDKDILVWRHMMAAHQRLVGDQRKALENVQGLPDMLKNTGEMLKVLDALQEKDTVPRPLYDEAMTHMEVLQAVHLGLKNEHHDLQKTLEEAERAGQKKAEAYERMKDNADRLLGELNAIDSRWQKRLREALESAGSGGQAPAPEHPFLRLDYEKLQEQHSSLRQRHDNLCRENEILKAVIDRLKEGNRELAGERDQKDHLLEILRDRIDTWIGERYQLQNEISVWKSRAALKWSATAAFAVAAGVTGYAAAGAAAHFVIHSAAPLNSLAGWTIALPAAAVGVFSALFNNNKLSYGLAGLAIGATLGFIFENFETAQVAQWMRAVEDRYCGGRSCLLQEPNQVNGARLEEKDGQYVITLPPGFAPKPAMPNPSPKP